MGRRGSSWRSAGRPGLRLGKDKSGGSWKRSPGPSAEARRGGRRRASRAGRACICVRRVLGARSHRQRSVRGPGLTADERQLIRPRESEAPGARAPWKGRLSAAGRRVSAAPHVAASRVAAGRADLLRPRRAQLPSSASPPSSGPTLSLPPLGSRWTRPPPAAAGSAARASELRGLWSRVPGTGLAPAFAHRGNLSLFCHQVPAEEGEGRGAAFPVPPARLDLRGLRLPGNSRAAAGPGSARGLLGARLKWFGTTSPGELEGTGGGSALGGRKGQAWGPGSGTPGCGPAARAPAPGEVWWAAADSPLSPFVSVPGACPRRGPACPSQSPRRPPLALQKGSLPGRAGDDPPGLGVPGAAPGRPAVPPRGLLSGTGACCFSRRTSPPC